MAKAEEVQTTYLIERRGEELRLTVPSSWKVTYAPVSPRSMDGKYALRFYEAENKQRAIFTDVVSFRDTSLPLQRKIVTKTTSANGTRSPKISYEAVSETASESWEDAI